MTVLSAYGTNTASATLSTANKLFAVTGATTTTNATKIGTATGYSEIFSQGTTGAWSGAGSIGAPSGNGWLWDVTTLEGNTISSGSWNASCRLSQPGGAGSISCSIFMRAYKRSSGGVYTAIGSLSLTGQTLTNSLSTFTMTSASLGSMAFSTGDKLYTDLWLNVTANTNGSSQNINCSMGNSSSQGAANNAEWDTPGYVLTGTNSILVFGDGLCLVI